MKEFIVKTFIFFLFASLFYIFILNFWGQYVPNLFKPNINYRIGGAGHSYSRLKEVKTFGEVDILFLGSSHASRGIDTRIFAKKGYRTFNLGSSAQTPIQTKVLIDRYLDILNPKMIIFEVYPYTFTADGVESSCDIISNDRNDFESFKMALKINNTRIYNTLIYGFSRDILGLNGSFNENKIKGRDTYISGGFVERKLSFYQPEKFNKKDITIVDYQMDSFLEIVKIIKNRNIKLILVFAPIPKVNYNSYTNIDYFDSIMRVHSPYYNFNNSIFLNDSLHFYDSHHLNQNGVKIFTNELLDLVEVIK